MLLVKSNYKPGWDLPDGDVEPGESPKRAARREVREEPGIYARIGHLLVVDWAPHPNEGDKLLFTSEGEPPASSPLSRTPDEVERVECSPVDQLDQAPFRRVCTDAPPALYASNSDVYLETRSHRRTEPSDRVIRLYSLSVRVSVASAC